MLDDSLLTRILLLALVLALLGVGYIAIAPNQSSEKLDELYLLNETGVAGGYPTSLTVGETGTVLVGVGNRRSTRARYRVEGRFANRSLTSYTVTLAGGETAERPVSFDADNAGEFTLRFDLYRPDGAGEPALTVRLRVTVSPEATDDAAQRVEVDASPLLDQHQQPTVGGLKAAGKDQER